jgi:NhaP-type Na+/H+ or K+/H+ antiporter
MAGLAAHHDRRRGDVTVGLYGAFFIGWGFGAVVGAVCGWMAAYLLMRRKDKT